MIPKSCRLFGQDHATEQKHDPEKLQTFSDKIMRPDRRTSNGRMVSSVFSGDRVIDRNYKWPELAEAE
jgi:hypothetical protein